MACQTIGTSDDNQCTKCNEGYYPILAEPGRCDFCDPNLVFHYKDENNNIHCMESCPVEYKYSLENSKECLALCPTDKQYYLEITFICYSCCPKGKYLIENEFVCYDRCPPEIPFTIINTYTCVASCHKHNLLEERSDNTCLAACLVNHYYDKKNKTCKEIVPCPKYYYMSLIANKCVPFEVIKNEIESVMNNIEDYIFVFEAFYSILKIDNTVYHVYNTSENSTKETQLLQNVSSISLGECEHVLRKIYNILPDQNLIILKKDINEGCLNSRIEFEMFSYDGTKIDMKHCEKIKIAMTIPLNTSSPIYKISKNFSSQGVDIFDNEAPFFKDVCIPYSNNSLDMPLVDRIKQLLLDNSTFCSSGCFSMKPTSNEIPSLVNVQIYPIAMLSKVKSPY